MEEVIRLENISKYYKSGDYIVKALDNINISVKKGEFLAIMGPSGSGKTTLLLILGLLAKPTQGKYYIKGKEVSNLDPKVLSKIRNKFFGFVFQQYYLFPNLTAIENVEIPMIVAGVPASFRRKRAMELLKLVGLENKANFFPSQLSGGQQQRVAIARALANDPEVILADEPTGALDVASAKQVLEIFKKLNKNYNKTIIVVTHDPKVASYADRILLIGGGKITYETTSIEDALSKLS